MAGVWEDLPVQAIVCGAILDPWWHMKAPGRRVEDENNFLVTRGSLDGGDLFGTGLGGV